MILVESMNFHPELTTFSSCRHQGLNRWPSGCKSNAPPLHHGGLFLFKPYFGSFFLEIDFSLVHVQYVLQDIKMMCLVYFYRTYHTVATFGSTESLNATLQPFFPKCVKPKLTKCSRLAGHFFPCCCSYTYCCNFADKENLDLFQSTFRMIWVRMSGSI